MHLFLSRNYFDPLFRSENKEASGCALGAKNQGWFCMLYFCMLSFYFLELSSETCEVNPDPHNGVGDGDKGLDQNMFAKGPTPTTSFFESCVIHLLTYGVPQGDDDESNDIGGPTQ